MTETEKLLRYCTINKRVCPLPQKWNELYKLLPTKKKEEEVITPPAPLILAGWNYSTDMQKMLRLKQHIEWADKHGALETVSEFLYSLNEKDWHHLNE